MHRLLLLPARCIASNRMACCAGNYVTQLPQLCHCVVGSRRGSSILKYGGDSMRKTVQLAVALVALPCIVGAAFAHGGRTDGQGCHHDRRSGGYHCHGVGHVQSHTASAATLGLYSAPSRLPVQSATISLPTPHHAPPPKSERPTCSDTSRADREKIMTMEMQRKPPANSSSLSALAR